MTVGGGGSTGVPTAGCPGLLSQQRNHCAGGLLGGYRRPFPRHPSPGGDRRKRSWPGGDRKLNRVGVLPGVGASTDHQWGCFGLRSW